MSDEYVPSKRSTFLYFAYGSNLWTKRIHLQNSSAIRKGIAHLKVKLRRFSLEHKFYLKEKFDVKINMKMKL